MSVLTTMSGAAIYFLNKTLDTAAVRKNLLASAEKEIFSWQFGDIFYTKKGTGTPMLLLHDLHCASSGREWQYIEDTLAQDHTVYTLDLLGCGRSDKPAITYTNFLYVQLIVTFIKQVIGCPTDVIASGLSGSFVVTACNTAPKCFGRIMMINPTDLAKLNKIPDKRSRFLKRMIELPLVGTLLYHTLTGRSNIELLFTESYYHNPFHRSPEDVDAFYESAHLQNSAGKYLFASLAGNYVNLNIGHALKHIDNSIFLILCAVHSAQHLHRNPDPAENKAHAADGGPAGPLRPDPDLLRTGTVIPPSAPGLERKNETKKTEDLLIFSLSVNPPFSILTRF